MKKIKPQSLDGTTLGVVLATLATIMVIVAIAANYTMNINRHVQRSNNLGTAIAIGDSCIEKLFAGWRDKCRNPATNASIPLPTSAFTALPTPAGSYFPNVPTLTSPLVKRGGTSKAVDLDPSKDADYDPNYTISNYKVIAISPEWTTAQDIGGNASANATPTPAVGPANTGNVSTSSVTYNYMAIADVTLPSLGPGGKVVARVRRVFQKQQISPWSFAIFYVDPLEIHPGPQFVVNGWVHTNSDLYTAHNTLTFTDKVSYVGDWYKGFMPGDGKHSGDTPSSPNYPGSPNYPSGLPYNGDLPPVRDTALQPFGLDSSQIFNTTDSNPNNDSYREIIEPPTNTTDPLSGDRYWDQASVVIEVKNNPNPSSPGFDGVNGHDLVTIGTPNANGTITALSTSSSLYQMFSGAIVTNQSIQDNREGATMGVTSLDLSQIETTVSSGNPSYKSANFKGIVYIYNKSATTNLNSDGSINPNPVKRGIRLKNGSKIPTMGLTVASNNPVYIQGDFNTGGTGSTVPSNVPANYDNDPTTPPPDAQVAGYSRAPTSVVADAVNILSNSWNDANSGNVPNASPTTVNTAVISGIVPTNTYGDNGYSGGAENFPRFLENWSNDTFTYYGSMVELYKSQQSIGEWGKANVYSPPTREWFFDTNFKSAPPPGSIMVYSYIKGRWSLL